MFVKFLGSGFRLMNILKRFGKDVKAASILHFFKWKYALVATVHMQLF